MSTICLVTLATATSYAQPTESPITWSVAPADETGRDGRSWVELNVDGGEQVTEYLAVSNFSDITVRYRLSAADGYFTQGGRFTMLPSTEQSRGAGTWIEIREFVDVDPGETVIVPFTITVPHDSIPGDHAAGVAASVLSRTADTDTAQVGLESRVGFRVMLRVSGELTPAFEVSMASGSYQMSWNPLRPGAARIDYELSNTGNTRLLITTAAAASPALGSRPNHQGPDSELLPGEDRSVHTTLTQVWPFGIVKIDLTASGVVTPSGEQAGTLERTIWVWAIPWPHLILLIGTTLLTGAMLWGRHRSRAHLTLLLEAAREEGERTARINTTEKDTE